MKSLVFKDEKYKMDFYTESVINDQVKRTGYTKEIIVEAYTLLFACALEELRKGNVLGPQKYKSIYIPKLGTFVPKYELLDKLNYFFSVKFFIYSTVSSYNDFYSISKLIEIACKNKEELDKIMSKEEMMFTFKSHIEPYILDYKLSLFLEKLGYTEDSGIYFLRGQDHRFYIKSQEEDKHKDLDKVIIPTYVEAFLWVEKTFGFEIQVNLMSMSFSIFNKNKRKNTKIVTTITDYSKNIDGTSALCKDALIFVFKNLLDEEYE
jgi:hypothetical protein